MIQPWYVGQTLPALAVTCKDDAGNVINLTGASLSLTLRSQTTNTDQAGAGGWVITSATAGQATYVWATADVAVAGSFWIFIEATYSAGVIKFDPVTFTITAAP